jgi:hypothetical protein
MNVDSLPQSSYPSSPPKDQDSTLTGLHHSGSRLVCVSSSWLKKIFLFSFEHLKDKYVELRDGSKIVKNFQMIWKRVFKVVKWTHTEKFLKCFLLTKYWIPLFQNRDSWSFSSFLFFSMLLSLYFFYCASFSLFFYYASFSLFFSLLRLFIEDEFGDF